MAKGFLNLMAHLILFLFICSGQVQAQIYRGPAQSFFGDTYEGAIKDILSELEEGIEGTYSGAYIKETFSGWTGDAPMARYSVEDANFRPGLISSEHFFETTAELKRKISQIATKYSTSSNELTEAQVLMDYAAFLNKKAKRDGELSALASKTFYDTFIDYTYKNENRLDFAFLKETLQVNDYTYNPPKSIFFSENNFMKQIHRNFIYDLFFKETKKNATHAEYDIILNHKKFKVLMALNPTLNPGRSMEFSGRLTQAQELLVELKETLPSDRLTTLGLTSDDYNDYKNNVEEVVKAEPKATNQESIKITDRVLEYGDVHGREVLVDVETKEVIDIPKGSVLQGEYRDGGMKYRVAPESNIADAVVNQIRRSYSDEASEEVKKATTSSSRSNSINKLRSKLGKIKNLNDNPPKSCALRKIDYLKKNMKRLQRMQKNTLGK